MSEAPIIIDIEASGFSREGYPIETHVVVTEDCYILQMHRIPYGKKSPPVESHRPDVRVRPRQQLSQAGCDAAV